MPLSRSLIALRHYKMALQPDHLIERAAALLKASSASRLRDAPTEAPAAIGPLNQTAPAMLPDAPAHSPAAVPLPPTLKPPAVDAGLGAADAPEFNVSVLPSTLMPLVATATLAAHPNFTPPAFTPIATPASAPLVAPRPALPRAPQTSLMTDQGSQQPFISIDALERAGMVVARAARTRISEEYRIVIGRVLRALREDPEGAGAHNVLMITSARPGEGKSFTALNLAGSIAQHSAEKVLLVDVDAKLHSISTLLGVGDRLGFHDLVVDQTLRPEDVILNTAIGSLTVLPVGSRFNQVSDTATVRPITPTITRLSRRFPKHLIVVDAPPCLSTSDPHTLAPFVGQVVMVIEAERTQRSEVEAALDLVRVCPTITILLNKVKLTTSHTFGAYDYYGSYS